VAAPVELSCGGTVHQYFPTVIDASLAPTATQVDLDRSSITTPLDRSRITDVDDSSISFAAGFANGYLVEGSLDRSSGKMNIRWLTAEEKVKLDHAGKAQMGMSADLKCAAATRLF
jgi:hypothetical protein